MSAELEDKVIIVTGGGVADWAGQWRWVLPSRVRQALP